MYGDIESPRLALNCGIVSDPGDITRILQASEPGDGSAVDRLLPAVYEELKQMASAKLARESGRVFQPTALVHEAYLRLVGPSQRGFENRGHFFAAAAEAMRRVLIDDARSRSRLKRGGGASRVDLDTGMITIDDDPHELLAIDEALTALESQDARKASLVKLRFFGGLTQAEAAGLLGVSRSTADNDWAYARAWLHQAIQGNVS